MTEDFKRGLFKTLAILQPYHLQIVIGGGWAPFLYYRYLVKNRERTPVLTRDIAHGTLEQFIKKLEPFGSL